MTSRLSTPPEQPSLNVGEALVMWLRLFQKTIRARDYDTAKTLFHKNATSIWTVSEARSIEKIVEEQWQREWPERLQFTFQIKGAGIIPCGNPQDSWLVSSLWESDPLIIGGGKEYGFATFLMKSFPDSLLCVHSHVSVCSA